MLSLLVCTVGGDHLPVIGFDLAFKSIVTPVDTLLKVSKILPVSK